MENTHETYQLIQKIKSDYAKGLPSSIRTQLTAINSALEDQLGITNAITAAKAKKASEQLTEKPFKKLYNNFVV